MFPGPALARRITVFHIKVVHTAVFWMLTACVLFTLYSGVSDRITTWTWIAIALLLLESVVLALSGWTCPLTLLAERRGAARGSVADIFLPESLADRIFPICGTTFGVALALVALRLLGR